MRLRRSSPDDATPGEAASGHDAGEGRADIEPAAGVRPVTRRRWRRRHGSGRSKKLRPSRSGKIRHWYILKVQSNREDSIREGLQRRVKIAGLQDFFGEIIVPIEMVSEFKAGKKRVVKRKLYPGYIVVNMEINEDTVVPGARDAGHRRFHRLGRKPSPMLPHEVSRIVAKQEEKTEEAPKLKISFKPGDRVKINEGTFENFEGDVDSIDEQNGRVTVMINIFGRSTPVELEYWQIESL